MAVHNSILELVGNTPLIRLHKLEKAHRLHAHLLAKVEFFNPGGSVKDRIGLSMIEEGLASGKINKDTTLIEPTSGNTGIGLASVAAVKGLKLIITMPENMSEERKLLMKAYGAQLELTDASKGMEGAIERAEELEQEIENAVIMGQFRNPVNPETHYRSTGPEIWEDAEGKVDAFVAGIGTGGTISGTGKFLKEKNPELKVFAMESAHAPFLSEGKSGVHKLQGLSNGVIADTLDTTIYDEILSVTDDEAFEAARELARIEGILVGISSGAALAAAMKVCAREDFADKNVVVLLPDTGERYLSTDLFR
ncbi:MAG: cysteine synthase A [Coriobacteriia bacterium]|nr:cysteine synthase A [Coriobacteriia bacterium]